MKETLVVNLFGGPGCGKSTLMARIFAELKTRGYDCEMVTEFAKDLVWEKRDETFKDELYIFAKQNHRLFRVNGKVDIIITDRPLLLTYAYNMDDIPLCHMCLTTFNKYRNKNFLIKRSTEYQQNGRNQNEDDAILIDNITQKVLDANKIDYTIVNNNDIDYIITIIELTLNRELIEKQKRLAELLGNEEYSVVDRDIVDKNNNIIRSATIEEITLDLQIRISKFK